MISNTPSIVYTPVLNYDGERYTDGTGYNLKLLRADQDKNHTLAWSLDRKTKKDIDTIPFYINSVNEELLQKHELYDYYAKQVRLKT